LLELAERLGFDGLDFEDFLTGLQVDTDNIADALENVGADLNASINDFAERSIPVQEATRDNTAQIADAVNRLIDAVRDGQAGDGRSLRTPSRVRP
jgi:DNA-binding ferritin-like protein